jgi:hypothetical protein
MNKWSPKGLTQHNGSPLITKNVSSGTNKFKNMIGKNGLKQQDGSPLITKTKGGINPDKRGGGSKKDLRQRKENKWSKYGKK